MAYVEPQHNAGKPGAAVKGVRMIGKAKEADLQRGDAQPGTVPTAAYSPPRPQNELAAATDGDVKLRKAGGALSELTRNRLAVNLRAMYDTLVQQPVPDRFADLIAQLESAERNKKS